MKKKLSEEEILEIKLNFEQGDYHGADMRQYYNAPEKDPEEAIELLLATLDAKDKEFDDLLAAVEPIIENSNYILNRIMGDEDDEDMELVFNNLEDIFERIRGKK